MRVIASIAGCAVAIGALSFGIAAQAADNPASAPKAAPRKDDPDRVICKSQEVTGSAIPKPKVCMTKHDWDALSENSREQMERTRTYNPDRH